jgi:protein dithiol oxidoreductase (disulfide-forming)
MLKHIRSPLRAFALTVLVLAAPVACAQGYTEGTHYKALKPAQPTSVAPGKIEVVEVFWYACAHCFAIEPAFESWEKKGKPANVEVVRVPATWNDMLKTHARVFYTAELLGKLPQLHAEIFREINVRGDHLDTPETIEAFFTSHGVSKADFQKVFSSFGVESKVRRAEELNKGYRITGTPTFVVNGKYVTDVRMAGSEENLFKVLNQLASSEKPGA